LAFEWIRRFTYEFVSKEYAELIAASAVAEQIWRLPREFDGRGIAYADKCCIFAPRQRYILVVFCFGSLSFGVLRYVFLRKAACGIL
jgi:hypothetical protein